MQCAESLRVQAYFDGEVDALSAAEIERHTTHCPQCKALLADLERTRAAIRGEFTLERAPRELEARIRRALAAEPGGERPLAQLRHLFTARMAPFWSGVLAGAGATALAAVAAFLLLSPSIATPLLDDLVASHVRSLLPSHLIDVASTDRHTVKPWFAGHADVSPVVADFAQQGFRLVGGRVDYLDDQRAAVVVYQHGAHVINVFSWVDGGGIFHVLPNDVTRNGYHLAFWKVGNVDYCAVSDTGWDELSALVRLLQDLGAHDSPR